jgi:hypothetical protein
MGAAGRAYASRHWERTATLRFLTDTVERVAEASSTGAPAPTAAKGRPRG